MRWHMPQLRFISAYLMMNPLLLRFALQHLASFKRSEELRNAKQRWRDNVKTLYAVIA